jgi:Tfp pilus assembly protein PilF
MNQQQFEYIFEKLTIRRREVLQRVLGGETDAEIARIMDIGEPTVRKHIERICQKFGLDNPHSEGRRYKRSELVTIFAKYKPDLLKERKSRFSDSGGVVTNTYSVITDELGISNQQTSVKQNLVTTDESSKFILQLLAGNSLISDDLRRFILRGDFNEQEKKLIAKSLNEAGHKKYLSSEFQSAISYLELAIEFKSDYGVAHYNLGATYEKLDNWAPACRHYKIAMRYQNRAADAAINNLARLEILQGNNQNAVAMIQPILTRVKDNVVKAALHKNLGWAYFQENSYQLAKDNLLLCLELEQDYLPAHCLLAQVQAAEGDHQGAIASWKIFLKLYDQELERVRWKLPELQVWKLDGIRALNSSQNPGEISDHLDDKS